MKELVEEGVNAFLVPISDSVALANKIKFLSNEPELLCEVAKKARKSFDEVCSSKALSEKISKIMLQFPNGKN